MKFIQFRAELNLKCEDFITYYTISSEKNIPKFSDSVFSVYFGKTKKIDSEFHPYLILAMKELK